jgi:hypothetical protein
VGVAKALGRLFMLAGLDRYAGVCSSAGTAQIITAYADGHQEGIAAYSEAIETSNAAPPDTDLLAWVRSRARRSARPMMPARPLSSWPLPAGS